MNKRIVFLAVLILGVVVALPVFAGGSQQTAGPSIQVNATGLPLVTTPVTLTATAILNPTARPLGEMPLFQDVQRLTNVTIDWQMIPASGLTERVNLILASQDYPDFFWHNIPSVGLPQTLGERGVVRAIDPYFDYATNLAAMLDTNPDVVPFLRNPDGNIYSFPYLQRRLDLGSAGDRPYINYDWLENLGLDVPTTPEEFYDVLVAFKTRDPNGNGVNDEIAMSMISGANNDISGWIALFGPWGVVYPQVVVDGRVELGHMQEGFREGLKFFNRLYREGLLDPESFTQNGAQLRAKATVNGTHIIGFFRHYVSWLVVDQAVSMYYMGFTDPTPNPNIVYDIMLPLQSADGTAIWPQSTAVPNYVAARGYVSTKTQYPELAVRWMDLWMDGKDWGYQVMEGQRGLNWDINSDGYVFPMDPPEGVTRNDWRAQHSYDSSPSYWSNDLFPQVPQYGWITQAEMVDKLRPYFDTERRFPSEYFPLPEEETTINRYWPGILLYINENMARFITGDLDIDRNWDQYLAGFRALGLEQVLQAYQGRYDRFTAVR